MGFSRRQPARSGAAIGSFQLSNGAFQIVVHCVRGQPQRQPDFLGAHPLLHEAQALALPFAERFYTFDWISRTRHKLPTHTARPKAESLPVGLSASTGSFKPSLIGRVL